MNLQNPNSIYIDTCGQPPSLFSLAWIPSNLLVFPSEQFVNRLLDSRNI